MTSCRQACILKESIREERKIQPAISAYCFDPEALKKNVDE